MLFNLRNWFKFVPLIFNSVCRSLYNGTKIWNIIWNTWKITQLIKILKHKII